MTIRDATYYAFGAFLLGSAIFTSTFAFDLIGLTGQLQNAAICAIMLLTVWFLIAHEERAENAAGFALGRTARLVVVAASAVCQVSPWSWRMDCCISFGSRRRSRTTRCGSRSRKTRR